MDFSDDYQDIILKGVTPFCDDELGRGAYGRIYTVDYYGTICAAKEIYPMLVEGEGQEQAQQIAKSFMRECQQYSTLRHPNIIQFLGVFFSSAEGVAAGNVPLLPTMIMEVMEDSLTTLVKRYEKIPLHIKFSIVHDVSLGLRYLHYHNPPIVHSDLFPNNILLTVHHVAKISDVGVAKVLNPISRGALIRAPESVADFMPPESLTRNSVYSISMDVFSFAGIILHTFNQQWPCPSEQVKFDPATRKMIALSEVQRRQEYLDKMEGETESLRPLVEMCLDNDPAVRPTIAKVCETIRISRGPFMEEAKGAITLHQQIQLKDKEIEELGIEIEQQIQLKDKEIKELGIEIEQQIQLKDKEIKELGIEIEQLQTTMQQMRDDINVKDAEIEQLKFENEKMPLILSTPNDITTDEAMSLSKREIVEEALIQDEMVITQETVEEATSVSKEEVVEQLKRVPLEDLGDSHGSATIKSKVKPEAPLLIPALTSGKYTMKWTKLAKLPAPMWAPYVTVHDKKVYVAGGNSSVGKAFDQVYVYDINTDKWSRLPPPGHYYGIPHIIGSKLAIVGGFLSTSNKRTNKVSTFDDASQTWIDFYPDLAVARSSPGIVMHLEHVIVAGG